MCTRSTGKDGPSVRKKSHRSQRFLECVEPEVVGDGLVRVKSVVESKRKAEDALSNLAMIGRYVFTEDIFDAVDRITPGAGGELQLTDAIGLLVESQPVYGCTFEHGRYHIGQKVDFLRANVELALDRPISGPTSAAWSSSWCSDADCSDGRGVIPLPEAQAAILAAVPALPVDTVAPRDALGLVLAEHVTPVARSAVHEHRDGRVRGPRR